MLERRAERRRTAYELYQELSFHDPPVVIEIEDVDGVELDRLTVSSVPV